MFQVDGRQILETLTEKVSPEHCAVVVIDMQKDFTSAGCFWDKLGQLDLDAMSALAARLGVFLDSARQHDVPVIHVMANYDGEYMNDPMHERLHRHGIGRYCQSGTEGTEFHPGLGPLDGETVVVKHRFDVLYDTELDLILKARGIRALILAGVAVQECVDSTARHAYFNGYYVVFGADLTGGASPTVHDVTLDSMQLMFGVTATGPEIVEAWTAGR
jgi:ureidoacrylate peracid hydrolase